MREPNHSVQSPNEGPDLELHQERAPRPRRLIVLCGVHGAGKSTGVSLLSRLGYLGHLEIGRAYRHALLFDDPDSLTLNGLGSEWFDAAVLDLELLRDAFIARASTIPHCVETWHVGNLAYASLRSIALVPRFEHALVSQSAVLNPTYVLLTIQKGTFLSRCALHDMSSVKLYEFYLRVEEAIVQCLDRHGLPYHLISNDGTLDELWESLKTTVLQSGQG